MSAFTAKNFFLSSVGKKYLMGASALVWTGFVLTHMLGNLLIFISHDTYNQYGHAITSGMLIYAIEALLILALITHVAMAVLLTVENRLARGSQRYTMTPSGAKGTSLASRTMAIQGSLILAFIILHIATFKYGTYYETTVDGVKMRDLARLFIEIFQQPGYVVWYVICLILLGFHLSHGVGSVFQSLGLKNDHYAGLIRKISVAYALIVSIGFLAQPLYVFFFAG